MRDWWAERLSLARTRLRHDGRAALSWSTRITVAAVASYVVGTLFFPGTEPLVAPLTAMLVVQVTPVSLLASGIDRVVAVVAGVFLAVGFAEVVPLEWWSLGLLILVAITVGQALQLRANQIEVPISAMLVLGVGALGAESAAWQRVAETLVGAAVGVAANLLLPPKVATADAGRAIDGLADSLSALLHQAADELESGDRDVATAARRWLDEARRINHDIPQAGAALLHAEQGRRLNVRAVVTPDVGPGLRHGLEALEHAAVAIRVMFRALVDATYDGSWRERESGDSVLRGLAQTFRELAAGVDTFGQLVRDESDPAVRVAAADVEALRRALDGLEGARRRHDDLLATESDPELLELHAALLSTVKRVRSEMDLDERIRRLVRQGRPSRARLPRTGSATRRPPRFAPPWPASEAETEHMPAIPDDPPRPAGPAS